jgi:RNA polymerase sigma factor (sigma-70 family)
MKKVFPRTVRQARSMMAAVVVGAAFVGMPGEAAQAAVPDTKVVNDISRYCQTCWRNARLHPDSWPDCTQEVLTRLLQTVEPARWSAMLKKDEDDHREFIRAIDAVKKRTQRSRKYNGLADDVADYRTQPESARNELREELTRAAREVLSPRQQQIVQFSCSGWSIPEIADELLMTVDRVSDEKYKAIRKLRKHMEIA